MATLASRDTSGVLQRGSGEVEVQRTRSAKKWLVGTLPDGRKQFRVGSTIGPLHYRADPFDDTEAWKEIDLTIRPAGKGKGWQYEVTDNGYQVRIWQRYMLPWHYTAEFRRAGEWVRMAPVELRYVNAAGERQTIAKPKKNLTPVIDNDAYTVTWQDCFGTGLHFRYNISPDQFAKTVVIDAPAALPAATIDSEGLRVEIVMGLAWSGQAGNEFGKGKDLSVLRGDDDGEDERKPRYGKHPHLRGDGLAALWMAEPRAWDAEGETLPMEWGLERKGRRVYGAFGVQLADLAGAAWPVAIDTAITEEQVGAVKDNAGEGGTTWPGDGSPSNNNTLFGFLGGSFYEVGWRWTSIPLDQGVTIDSAAFSLRAKATSTSTVPMTIAVEDVDDAADFTYPRGPHQVYLAKTSAVVNWTPEAWTAGTWYASSDFKSAVQEVVDRGGWSANNDIAVVAYCKNTSTAAYRQMDNYTTGSAYAAKFNCTYTVPSPPPVTATRALETWASATVTGTRPLAAFGSASASSTRSLAVTGAALVTTLRSLAASGSTDADTSRALEAYASDLQAAVRDVAAYGTATEAGTRAAEVLGQVTVEATRLVETWASDAQSREAAGEAWGTETQDATRAAEAWASDTQADEAAAEAWGEETLTDTAPAEAWGADAQDASRTADAWGAATVTATASAEAYGAASQVATLAAEVYGAIAASALREVATYGADTQAASRVLEALGSTGILATVGMEVWGVEGGTEETITALREMAAWGAALMDASRSLAAYGAEKLDATRTAEVYASAAASALREVATYGAASATVSRMVTLFATGTETTRRDLQAWASVDADAARALALYGAGVPSATVSAEVWGWALARHFRLQALPGRFEITALPGRFTITPLPERFTITPLPGRFVIKALPGRFTKEAL